MPVGTQLTSAERLGLGVVTFFVTIVPVIGVASLCIANMFGFSVPNSLFSAAFLVFIIAVGLSVPLWSVLAEAAGDRVPARERNWLRPRSMNPFSAFVFWWRYVRRP